MLNEDSIIATPADKDALIESVDDIKADSAQDWAKANVEKTRQCLSGLWKAAP